LKILANLAIAIHFSYQNGYVVNLKLKFGKKLCVGDQFYQENSNLFELLSQLKTIKNVFGIKEEINFDI